MYDFISQVLIFTNEVENSLVGIVVLPYLVLLQVRSRRIYPTTKWGKSKKTSILLWDIGNSKHRNLGRNSLYITGYMPCPRLDHLFLLPVLALYSVTKQEKSNKAWMQSWIILKYKNMVLHILLISIWDRLVYFSFSTHDINIISWRYHSNAGEVFNPFTSEANSWSDIYLKILIDISLKVSVFLGLRIPLHFSSNLSNISEFCFKLSAHMYAPEVNGLIEVM